MPCGIHPSQPDENALFAHRQPPPRAARATPTLRSPWGPAARACTASRANMRDFPALAAGARGRPGQLYGAPPADACALYRLAVTDAQRAHISGRVAEMLLGRHALPLFAARQRALRAGHRPTSAVYHYFCSQFVASVLAGCGALELPKPPSLVRPRTLSAWPASISPTPAPSAVRRAWRTSLKRGRPAMAFREGRELTERGQKAHRRGRHRRVHIAHLRRGLVRGPPAARLRLRAGAASAPGWTARATWAGCISSASRYCRSLWPSSPESRWSWRRATPSAPWRARCCASPAPSRAACSSSASCGASASARWRCSSPGRR